MRTSRKARIAAARRVARDRVADGRRSETVVEPAPDDRGDPERGRILHEEIVRLPGSYRAAVVACYLEGLTQAEAACQLRLAESTVPRAARPGSEAAGTPSRSPRGRPGRGAPGPGRGLRGEFVGSATSIVAALPEAIVRSVAAPASGSRDPQARRCAGAVPSTAVALADGVLSTMWLPSLKTVTLAAALAVVTLGLTVAATAGLGRSTERAAAPAASRDPRPAEPASPLPQAPDEERPRSSRKGQGAGASAPGDPDLARRPPGPIGRAVPVSKDQMVLSYLPDWSFGHVDNIGIGNNGCRTLIEWPRTPMRRPPPPIVAS